MAAVSREHQLLALLGWVPWHGLPDEAKVRFIQNRSGRFESRFSTLKIEELVHQLKSDYTIIIVTHNMQQAARVSDYTAFMYMGKLIEYAETNKLFTNPAEKQTEDYITGRYG